MYLGLAIYETLDEDGELKSDIMSPPEPDEVRLSMTVEMLIGRFQPLSMSGLSQLTRPKRN